MKEKELIERVQHFEEIFDEANRRVHELDQAIQAYREILPEIRELEAYYDGGLWQQDYQADEEGLIPQEIKRGVLSEDGVYDFLMDQDRVESQLKK